MPKKPVLLDTNVFIDFPEVLEDYKNIVFSITVLKELDTLKFKKDIGYSARSAIRSIRKFKNKAKEFVVDTNMDSSLSADMNIILAAKRNNATLITSDISMSLLAESFNVACDLIEKNNVCEFSPYIIDNKPGFPFDSNNLEGESLTNFKKYIKEKFERDLKEWDFYLTKRDIFCYNPKKDMLECISQNKEYCEIVVDDGISFKPKDRFQKAAIYSILNSDATLIIGGYGTGKSLVSTACALSIANDRKVFILRPTITSKRYDVGFLPGDKSEKLYQFFSGFMSALSFLYGNTRTTASGKKGVSYDYVKEDLSHDKFEFLSMPELHGLSIQEGDILLVDEVQLLDQEYFSLLLSRVGQGAKIVLMGDLAQTVNLLKQSESGLNKLLSLLPDKSISVVELKEVYRNSDLCKLADRVIS